MRKLPLIFLPLLLIALSACSRSPSPPTAEPPVLATQPTEQTTIPPEQTNEPGQESSSQPVTEPMPEPTVPSVTEPASTAAAADTPPNTEPASQPPAAYGAACHKVTGSTHTAGANNRTACPAGDGTADRSPIRHRLLDRLCADRRHGKGAGSGTIGRGLLGQPHLRKSKLHLPGARHHRPTEPLCR